VPCGKHGREVLRRQLIVGPGAPLASFLFLVIIPYGKGFPWDQVIRSLGHHGFREGPDTR